MTGDAPRVSVIMPVYNGEPYVGLAIKSMLEQTFDSLEVIVVDGDSTDATREIVEEIRRGDARVRLDRQKRTGIVDGRNRGAALARGEYLAWLDADDVALPDRLERQVQFMDARPQLGALGGGIVITDDELRPLFRVRYPTEHAQIASILPMANVLAASAVLIRAAAYKVSGGCRQPFSQGAEDYDLWLRMSEQYELANLPQIVAYYRTHRTQVSATGVERFVIPTVAVQLSAQARRDGRPDVYGHAAWFTYDFFTQTESSRASVDNTILRVAASQATFLALIGQPAAARELLRWAADLTSTTTIERQTLARVAVAESLVAWRARRLPEACMAGLHAAVLDPRHLATMLAKGLRARLDK